MKYYFQYPIAIITILSSVACSNYAESPDQQVSEKSVAILSAKRESVIPDTKVIRQEDGSVYWEPMEEVSVFNGVGTGGGSKFVSTNTQNTEIVEFSGSINLCDVETLWAVYPFSFDNSCDGSSVVTVVPSTQMGIEDNFSNHSFPAIAKSGSTTLSFLNVCGGIKFSVSRNDIRSVTFEGNNNEILAGKVKLGLGSQGTPEVVEVLNGSNSVTLYAPDNGTFKPGKYYYMSILPTNMEKGFCLRFKTSTYEGLWERGDAKAIKRSIFGVLREVDTKVSNWEENAIPDDVVNLGLSVYWAKCNLGASSPEQDGDYYRWGEYVPMGLGSYKWTNPDGTMIKYCMTPDFGKVDGLSSLEVTDDAATMNKGSGWRIPSFSEMEELVNDCSWEWVNDYDGSGTCGFIVSGTKPGFTENCIFLPAAGFRDAPERTMWYRSRLLYWTRDVVQHVSYNAWYLIFYEKGIELHDDGRRYYGKSIRPVYSDSYNAELENTEITDVAFNDRYVIMNVGDNVLLSLNYYPKTAKDNRLIWESSDNNVVTVDNQGNVTALASGSATIKVSSINQQATSSIDIFVRSDSERIGEILDSNGIGIIVWIAEDKETAMLMSVNELQSNSNWAGSNKWCEDYGEGWRMPTIDDLTRIHVYFDRVNLSLGEMGYTQLSTQPNNYYWSSTNYYMSNNYIKMRLFDGAENKWSGDSYSPGSYVRAVKNVTLTPLDRISLNKERIEMDVAETEQLMVSFEPADVPHRPVLWTSSNPSVARVNDSGLITAIGEGVTTITAQVEDRIATCSVFVSTIKFEDSVVESICLSNWDRNQDGVLSYSEASIVMSLGEVFQGQEIKSFDELAFFTGLSDIGKRWFYNCTKLKSIVIPNSVTSIGSDAFYGCDSLTSVVVSGSLTTIGDHAFTNCKSLVTIDLPESVTSIDSYAFYGCESLTSIIIPKLVTTISRNVFCDCSSLKSVVLVGPITLIDYHAFENCKSLVTINLPNSVASIEYYAFYGCESLTSLTIPESVTYIGMRAFYNCHSLVSVSVLPLIPPSDAQSLFNYDTECLIYVPLPALEAYKTAQNWRNYADRIYPIPSE